MRRDTFKICDKARMVYLCGATEVSWDDSRLVNNYQWAINERRIFRSAESIR